MEDVFTVKVRRKPSNINSFPSERRYSASTVSGFAWIHLSLAAVSMVFLILVLMNPVGSGHITHLNLEQSVNQKPNDTDDFSKEDIGLEPNVSTVFLPGNITKISWILITSPVLLIISGLSAGFAAIMASVRWYVDKNITWLFIASIFSLITSCFSLVIIVIWLVGSSQWPYLHAVIDGDPSTKTELVTNHNQSYYIIKIPYALFNSSLVVTQNDVIHIMSKRSLSFNILMAALIEIIWSLVTLKVAWKGMLNVYDDNALQAKPKDSYVHVITSVKGNNIRNGLPQRPDILHHYPHNMNQIYLTNVPNHYYMKEDLERPKMAPDETNSQYRERMLDFLNRCDSFDGSTLPDTPSLCSEPHLKVIPESPELVNPDPESLEQFKLRPEDRISSLSWGDSHDTTVYNQDTLDLDKIISTKLGKVDSKKESAINEE